MRYLLLVIASLAALAGTLVVQERSAEASFHCMRIDAVMAGFNGNNNVQYVELRLSAGGQTFVGGHKIRFYDASNTLKATFTFPSNATNGLLGDSILIGTQEFNSNTNGGDTDFTFSGSNTTGTGDVMHPIQSPGGKIVYAGEAGDFNCNLGAPPADSLAYGSFTGPIDFGTMPAPALPSPSDNRALRLNTLTLKPSNNATEYSVAAVSTSTFSVSSANLASDLSTPRNNGRTVLQLTQSVGGIAELPSTNGGPAVQSRSSGSNDWFVAELSVAAGLGVLALTGTFLYARRRRLR